MKKNDWILLVTAALYSFLFYDQTAGINFLLFTIFLVIALIIKDTILVKKPLWWLAAIGSLVSAGCIGIYGNNLSLIANMISLGILSGLSLNSKSSVIFSLIASFVSPFHIIPDTMEKWQNRTLNKVDPSYRKIILILIPLLITLLFFFIYKASNTLFNDFTKKLNFDFISMSWITFTLGGLVLLYGFFYHKKFKSLSDFDEVTSNKLEHDRITNFSFFGKNISIRDEDFSGKLLFLSLNVMLLIVNGLDFNFLFITGELPKDISYSQFVHQGTGALIISILIAIAIILYYFRGALNFYQENKTIKILACLWVFQNALMLVSTAFRNNLYIHEYGLTDKRIGVYVYLLLTLIGLATTFIKIMNVKSNMFLFRINGWIFYGVLIISCLLNYDMIITNYNIHTAKVRDEKYLLTLSNVNLPQMVNLSEVIAIEKMALVKQLPVSQKWEVENHDKEYYPYVDFNLLLSRKLYDFQTLHAKRSWQSWYAENSRADKELSTPETNKKIKVVKLMNSRIESLLPLSRFKNIEEMDLQSNKIKNIKELTVFPSLNKLNLNNNKLRRLEGIENLKKLEYLNLNNNDIDNYMPLYKLTGLKELHVSKFRSNLYGIEALTNLERLEIGGYPKISDYSPLYQLKKLKELKLHGVDQANLELLRIHLPQTLITQN